jgi:signal transduction histidine kinase
VLQQDERRARERAEAAEARASLLAEWSRLLASSLDTPTALEYLPRLVVPRWAAACLAAVGDDVVGGGDAVGGGPAAAGADPTADLWPRFEAPVVTGEGRVGRVVVAGAGALAADQGLADELASRLGLAAEHARLLAAAELATSERERLLAVVAHDLRNPLGAVAMYAEMLASLQPPEGDGDPAGADRAAGGASREAAYTRDYTRAAIATIHQSAAGMQRLVEDLLDASSLRGGALRVHRTPARLGDAFAEAERMLAPLADRAGLALAIEAEGGAADRVAPVDAPRLVQLLSNLVGNAVKFTPPGGRVAVRYRADADALGASVSDTGPGIAAEDLPHLFTAFWRGDRRGRRGVGLGLWIARAVVEAHGGELAVDTGPGRGTTFHFTLPFADAVRRRED